MKAFILSLVTLFIFGLSPALLTGQAADLTERGLMKPTKWFWYTGVTAEQIKTKTKNDYRVIDLEIESTNPLKFSAALVKNSGAHKKGWYWYYGKTSQQIKELIDQKKSRIIDLEIYYVNGQKRYAVVMVSNQGTQKKGWWYYSELSFDQVSKKLKDNNARLIDLDTYVKSGTRKFSAVMVPKKGKDAKTWWYYSNLSASELKQKLAENKARITDIEIRNNTSSGPRFTVIMEKLAGETWWWYYGKTLKQVKALADQNGARIVDIESYKNGSGSKRLAVVMIRNTNDLTNRMRRYLRNGQRGGSYGLYLKQVNGSVLGSLQSDKTFYPASTIKVLEHAHAMRAVQSGKVKLSDKVIKFENGSQSCQDNHRGHKASSVSLEAILKTMMENSDNQSTNAVQEFFSTNGSASSGRAKMNATAYNVLGMSKKTKLNHKFGCGGPNNDPANSLILRDISRLYEKVATGALSGSHREKFYQLMSNGKGHFYTIIDQEAKKLGISNSVKQSFKNKITTAAKAGSFKTNGTFYQSIGGWVSLPLKNGSKRAFTYGLFIDEANSIKEGFGIWTASGELLREQINKALATYK